MDTTWLDIYVTHLKAGDSDPDEADRSRMVDSLRNYLDQRPSGRNVVFAGDLNLYSSFEPAWTTLTEFGSDVVLADPISRPGSWNSNSSFEEIHTQSTRTSSIFGDGAGGGMDSRFDFIMLSNNMLFPANRISYIEDSYIALGNDGTCYNQRILDCGGAPDRILTALYYMSDHLPVALDVQVKLPIFSGIDAPDETALFNAWHAAGILHVESIAGTKKSSLQLTDLTGRVVFSESLPAGNTHTSFTLPPLPQGVYVLSLQYSDVSLQDSQLIYLAR